MHEMRLQRLRKKKQTKELLNTIEQLPADTSHEQIETLELQVSAKAAGSRGHAKFERRVGDVIWSTVTPSTSICPKVCICADEHLPIRTAKNHATFRHSMLEHMLQVQRILSNMVLFKCNRCKSRPPTFHPKHQPWFTLDATKHCSIEVATWDTQPPATNRTMATFHTGMCQVCSKNLRRADEEEDLKDICTFGPENNWDPLNNIDDVRFPFGRDIGELDRGALLKELRYCHDNATVTESMFVALEHMQVV